VLESTDGLASLESLVRQYSRFVFKVAYGVVRNPHEAEDVVQEVFLRVHSKGVQGVKDMRAWLATLAFRIAIDRIRQPRADELGELEPTSEEPDAEQVAVDRQRMSFVQRLIAALPDDLRHPLVLSAIGIVSRNVKKRFTVVRTDASSLSLYRVSWCPILASIPDQASGVSYISRMIASIFAGLLSSVRTVCSDRSPGSP